VILDLVAGIGTGDGGQNAALRSKRCDPRSFLDDIITKESSVILLLLSKLSITC